MNDATICPLNLPICNNFIPIENEVLKMGGCCACHDAISKEHTCSDKASQECSNSFRLRLKNNKKVSCLTTKEYRDSLFCLSYPSEKMGLKGKYEWLQLHCASGFNSNDHVAANTINDDAFYCETAKLHIDSAHLRNESMAISKIILISYLIECCCDMILSKQHKVSESPGCEKNSKKCGRHQDN